MGIFDNKLIEKYDILPRSMGQLFGEVYISKNRNKEYCFLTKYDSTEAESMKLFLNNRV